MFGEGGEMVPNENLRITFSSAITNMVECNSSFDCGVLQIAYHGQNRNGQFISKEVFERCAHTMFNKPIVAHYIREEDEIGGHDAEIIRRNGEPRMVNVTQPVGVVPESAMYSWREVTEDDGSVHEYLCVEVLLWKRQEAYEKIREDGITAESMEIGIRSARTVDGLYYIDDFEFLAFCLLGNCKPCFESASLALFSDEGFQGEVEQMLAEASSADFKLKEVRNKLVNEKLMLMGEFGLKLEDLDFELDEFSVDELREKFAELRQRADGQSEISSSDDGVDDSAESFEEDGAAADDQGDEPEEGHEDEEQFSLSVNQLMEELDRVLGENKIETEYGACRRYFLRDCDHEGMRAICWDCGPDGREWMLVALPYNMSGDVISIDYDNAKRVKIAYEEFEGDGGVDGEDVSIAEFVAEQVDLAVEYNKAKFDAELVRLTGEVESLTSEVTTLREFKANVEHEQRVAAERNIFAQFTDLEGVEAYETLKADCSSYSLEELEEKCFAVRGKQQSVQKFSVKETGAPVLPVGGTYDSETEPYGGLVKKYTHK